MKRKNPATTHVRRVPAIALQLSDAIPMTGFATAITTLDISEARQTAEKLGPLYRGYTSWRTVPAGINRNVTPTTDKRSAIVVDVTPIELFASFTILFCNIEVTAGA
jgi:hypothetical protein